RRTCGSLLAALDVHPRVAMAILRHSRIALTMEVYTQVPDKTTRDALKRLSDLLGGPEGNTEATTQNTDTETPNEGHRGQAADSGVAAPQVLGTQPGRRRNAGVAELTRIWNQAAPLRGAGSGAPRTGLCLGRPARRVRAVPVGCRARALQSQWRDSKACSLDR